MNPSTPNKQLLLDELRKQIYPHLERYKIIFVDDEPITVKHFEKIFAKTMPSQIVAFSEASEALEYIKKKPAECALILADEHMPKMPGHQFLELCRAIAPKSFRMITSVLSIGHVNYGVETIHMPVVVKPWNVNHLNRFLICGLEYFILRNDKIMQSYSNRLKHYQFQHWVDNLMTEFDP